MQYLVCSPCPKTPVEPACPGLTDTHCCLRHWRLSRLPLDALTRLTGFTLSHYGSHTSLPTLKPNLAIAAPRLCTDCLPGFVGAGVSPSYTAYTELAHLQLCPIRKLLHRFHEELGLLGTVCPILPVGSYCLQLFFYSPIALFSSWYFSAKPSTVLRVCRSTRVSILLAMASPSYSRRLRFSSIALLSSSSWRMASQASTT